MHTAAASSHPACLLLPSSHQLPHTGWPLREPVCLGASAAGGDVYNMYRLLSY